MRQLIKQAMGLLVLGAMVLAYSLGLMPETKAAVTVRPVTGLVAKDALMGGRIQLTWNERGIDVGSPSDPWSYCFYVFRNNGGVFTNLSEVDHSGGNCIKGNFFEDSGLVNGISYQYKVMIGINGSIPDPSVATAAYVTPTGNLDMTIEDVMFVIPSTRSSDTGYTTKLANAITDLNTIYAKNTNKRFRLKEVRYYDYYKWCGQFAMLPNQQCSWLPRNNFYTPGVSTVFEIPSPYAYTSSSSFNPYYVIMNYGPDTSDKVISYPVNLAHEFAHTFGVGSPEYYYYRNSDNSGVQPIDPSVEHLPATYKDDPMDVHPALFSASQALFGPLSVSIINSNPKHFNTYNRFYTTNALPRTTQLKVYNRARLPLAGATVKVFCAYGTSGKTYETQPRQTLTTDANGFAVIQQVFGGSLLYKNGIGGDCFLAELKVSQPGYVPFNKPLITLNLQEAKITQQLDTYMVVAPLEYAQ